VRGLLRTMTCLVLGACASRQSAPNDVDGPRGSDYRPPEVILRNTSWEDPELAARGLGRLEFVVRVADRPAQVVADAQVSVKPAGVGNAWQQVMADANGVARLDSIAVGRYELTVRRIGYGPLKSEAVVSPGCRTDVEAYIGVSAVGIAPPPPEPGRVRVTTCRVRR
jgi:carboxypeptidase family protein